MRQPPYRLRMGIAVVHWRRASGTVAAGTGDCTCMSCQRATSAVSDLSTAVIRRREKLRRTRQNRRPPAGRRIRAESQAQRDDVEQAVASELLAHDLAEVAGKQQRVFGGRQRAPLFADGQVLFVVVQQAKGAQVDAPGHAGRGCSR